MNERARKRLPWTYYDALGWGGKHVDEERACNIVRRVGLDAANDHGDTPLTVAAVLGRVGMVRWLLEQGADVEDVAPHQYFKPALCAAAYGKRAEVAALLIAAGANLESRDRFGHTPLANAFINCFTDPLPLAALLIEHGAEVTERVRELGESWNAVAFHAFLARVTMGDRRSPTEPLVGVCREQAEDAREDLAEWDKAEASVAPDRGATKRKRGSRSTRRRGT
jgi:ankyrin repeat protein